MTCLTREVQDKCGREVQWGESDVVEQNRRWSSRGNLTLPLSEEGLYFVAEGAVHGKVEFVEDASLEDYAAIDFNIEYDDWVFAQTKFCMLEHITGSGIGIFVSDNSLFHNTRQQSDLNSRARGTPVGELQR